MCSFVATNLTVICRHVAGAYTIRRVGVRAAARHAAAGRLAHAAHMARSGVAGAQQLHLSAAVPLLHLRPNDHGFRRDAALGEWLDSALSVLCSYVDSIAVGMVADALA